MYSIEAYKYLDLCQLGDLYEKDGEILSYVVVESDDLYLDCRFVGRDRNALLYALEDLIKEAPHYLVFASNCRWDGASGYKIVDFMEEIVARDYEVSIYPIGVSKGGKTLMCREYSEYSHDVPMGARTTIIALTEKEYGRLIDASWEQVAKFVGKHEGTAR